MVRKIIGVSLCIAVVLAAGFYTQNTLAATSPAKTGLAISPPTFELSANPGDVLKNSIRVDNITEQTLDVSASARNFTALGEEGGIDLSDQEGRYALASWMRITPGSATLAPGGSKTFNFTITVPQNAEPGGRFGSVIFKTTAKALDDETGLAIAQEVGALVFIKIAGEVTEKAAITSFAAKNTLNEHGPVDFNVKIKNQGNVQFKPTGTITITNFFGRKVATIPIDAQNVLPDATRRMTARWNNGWMFGKYQATASVVYGSDHQIITASTTFWGFPYRLIGIILVIALLIGALLYPRRKRIKQAFSILFGRQ